MPTSTSRVNVRFSASGKELLDQATAILRLSANSDTLRLALPLYRRAFERHTADETLLLYSATRNSKSVIRFPLPGRATSEEPQIATNKDVTVEFHFLPPELAELDHDVGTFRTTRSQLIRTALAFLAHIAEPCINGRALFASTKHGFESLLCTASSLSQSSDKKTLPVSNDTSVSDLDSKSSSSSVIFTPSHSNDLVVAFSEYQKRCLHAMATNPVAAPSLLGNIVRHYYPFATKLRSHLTQLKCSDNELRLRGEFIAFALSSPLCLMYGDVGSSDRQAEAVTVEIVSYLARRASCPEWAKVLPFGQDLILKALP